METAELTRGASAPPGLFALPAISQEIPVVIEEASERSRVMARFALASEAQGLQLPGGNFIRLEEVVAQQWTLHLNTIADRFGETLLGSPSLVVTDEDVTVLIGARAGIDTFRLKPVIEALEQSLPGLGWFVVDVLSTARCSGLFFYDMTMVAYHLDYRLSDLDEFTDQAYARAILSEEGTRDYDDESEVPPEQIEEMREAYGTDECLTEGRTLRGERNEPTCERNKTNRATSPRYLTPSRWHLGINLVKSRFTEQHVSAIPRNPPNGHRTA